MIKVQQICANCGKPTDELYEVYEEGFCKECFDRAVYEADRQYDASQEGDE